MRNSSCRAKANEQRNVIVSLFELIVRKLHVSHSERESVRHTSTFWGVGWGVSVGVYVPRMGANKLKMPQMRKIQVQIETRAAH